MVLLKSCSSCGNISDQNTVSLNLLKMLVQTDTLQYLALNCNTDRQHTNVTRAWATSCTSHWQHVATEHSGDVRSLPCRMMWPNWRWRWMRGMQLRQQPWSRESLMLQALRRRQLTSWPLTCTASLCLLLRPRNRLDTQVQLNQSTSCCAVL